MEINLLHLGDATLAITGWGLLFWIWFLAILSTR